LDDFALFDKQFVDNREGMIEQIHSDIEEGDEDFNLDLEND